MVESGFNGDSLARIEDESLVEEVNAFRGRSREEILEVDAFLLLEALQVFNRFSVGNEVYFIFVGRAENGEDHVQLVTVRVREAALLDGVVSVRREREATRTGEERRSV